MRDPPPNGEREVLSSYESQHVDVRSVRRYHQSRRGERCRALGTRLCDRGADQGVRQIVQRRLRGLPRGEEPKASSRLRAIGRQDCTRPWPPSGSVSNPSLNSAISGLPAAIASCTEGREREAW